MRFIADQVYEIRRFHHEIIKGKKVRVVDELVVKSIDIVPFKRRNKNAEPGRVERKP